MPKEAIDRGAVDKIVALGLIPNCILRRVTESDQISIHN
jgi:chemotaxis response regulator CheB